MSRDATIALIRSSASEDAVRCCRGLETTLAYVGLRFRIAQADSLQGSRIALLPHGEVGAREISCIARFVQHGGRLLLGLQPPVELLALLGLVRVRTREANVGEMLFPHKTLHNLPLRWVMTARSFSLCKAGPGTKPLAHWHTLDDLTLKDPACYLAPQGAWLTTAVATGNAASAFSEDRLNLGRLLAALVNHFVPDFDHLRFQRNLTELIESEEDCVRAARPRDFEMRALWMPHVPTPNEVAIAARDNFNVLCPHVGAIAAQQYERTTFRRPWLLREPLMQGIDQAHRSGIELFPYVTAWAIPGAETARFLDGMGRTTKDTNPVPSLCPTNPDNQQSLLDGVTTLLNEFGTDGIVVGGLRFASPGSCQCDGCKQRFATWLEAKHARRTLNLAQQQAACRVWRRDIITGVLKRLLTACRATNPNARLAVACLPSGSIAAREYGQDAAHWAEQNLADVLMPFDFTNDAGTLRHELATQAPSETSATRLCAGLGVYSSVTEISSPAELVKQIEAVRERDWDGVLLWHEHPALFRRQFVDGLLAGAMKTAAKLPWHPNAPSRRASTAKAATPRAARGSISLPSAEC